MNLVRPSHSEAPILSGEPPTEKLYPIAEVASELDCGVKDLRRKLPGQVVRDENLMRCVPGSVVRQLIEERDAEIVARREDAKQRRENRNPNPTRERVEAIKFAQHASPFSADTPDGDMAKSAMAQVMAPEVQKRWDSSGRRMDEYKSGEVTYHRINAKEG
ncbi:hypothetical protein [Mycobacterium marseillense]|uniref:hypothetical protein n=1 Tax=Mycobacterium marseillense TaxID=701042 RepID=UPI0012FD4AFF|nr:hypothetical protein [Mycobacterium marseillense]